MNTNTKRRICKNSNKNFALRFLCRIFPLFISVPLVFILEKQFSYVNPCPCPRPYGLLKDILQVLVLVLVHRGQVLVLGFGLVGQVLVLVLVLGGQVLVNIPDYLSLPFDKHFTAFLDSNRDALSRSYIIAQARTYGRLCFSAMAPFSE